MDLLSKRTLCIFWWSVMLSPVTAFTTTCIPNRIVTRHGLNPRYPTTTSLPKWEPAESMVWMTLSSSSSSSERTDGDAGSTNPETVNIDNEKSESEEEVVGSPDHDGGVKNNVSQAIETTSPSLYKRIVSFYRRDSNSVQNDDGLTFRQRLAKAGLSVMLSYGWVSNMSYCISVSAAWYIFCRRNGLSPLAQGQWPKFLAIYSGFWVFNNVVRPIRFGLSVAISTQFDKIVNWIQAKARVKKSVAIGLTIFLANVVGTTTLMCAGIALAASLAGVPIFPPK